MVRSFSLEQTICVLRTTVSTRCNVHLANVLNTGKKDFLVKRKFLCLSCNYAISRRFEIHVICIKRAITHRPT